MRALIRDERQRRVTCQCLRRCSQVSISQVGRLKHDMRWKRLNLACVWIEIANVAGKHVSNTRSAWRDVLPCPKSFSNFSVDFRHRFTLHEQLADTQDLGQNRNCSFSVEANRLLIQRVVAVHDAGEAVCALPDFNEAAALQDIHSRALPQMLRRSAKS